MGCNGTFVKEQNKQTGLYPANPDTLAAGAPEGTGIETEAHSATKPSVGGIPVHPLITDKNCWGSPAEQGSQK